MTAILLGDLETKKNGEPRFKKDQRFPVIDMDFFWMKPEEKGGIGVDLGPLNYLRLTYPNGEKTQYFDMFEIKDGQ